MNMGSRTAHNLYMEDHITRLSEDISSTTKRLELEKRRLNKLDQEVESTRLEHQKKVLRIPPKGSKGKDDKEKGKKEQKVESIRTLEHRKMQAVAQLDALENENKEIRVRIDSTRRERMQMNQIFKKLHVDIKENIGQVTTLQRDTDTARNQQEDAQNRVLALKKQLEHERKVFNEQVKQMHKKMQDEVQGQRQEDLRQTKEATIKKETTLKDPKKTKTLGLMAEEEESFNSQALMRRILKLAFLNAIQRRHIKSHKKNIEVFEQAFMTIKSTTGISDIEEIVKIFVKLEQRNFSLLTYVNMLNREIETFEMSNRELDQQLTARKVYEEQSVRAKHDALTDKKQQIKNTQKVTEENQMQARLQEKIVEECKPLIQGILKTVERENKGFGGSSAPELTGENILAWLTYVEKTLTQWKDFLPDTKDARHGRVQPSKNYKYTVGNQVLQLQPKKHNPNPEKGPQLVRANDLPSANLEPTAAGQQRGAPAGREEDNSDEEEDMESQFLSLQELRDKAVASVAKKKRHRKTDQAGATGQPAAALEHGRAADAEAAGVGEGGGPGGLGYEDMIAEKPKADDDDSLASDDSDMDEDIGPTDEEINEIFLKRYKMSKEELQGMADKMRIQLNNLCYLKQEFDNYDEDRSGYIDVKELKGLLQKLGEELRDDELDQAFRELDSDGSGEIEFFEFVEWFTSED